MTFWASRETIIERAQTCAACSFLFRPTGQCRKCGCFVKLKVKVASQNCPINKWLPEPESDPFDNGEDMEGMKP